MTWSPLACGIISGKYGNGVPESSRASLKVFSSSSRRVWGWETGMWRGRQDEIKSCAAARGFPLRQSMALGGHCPLAGCRSPEPARGLCSWPSISQPFIICQHEYFSSSGAWEAMPNDLVEQVGAQIPPLLCILMLKKSHFGPPLKLTECKNPFSI